MSNIATALSGLQNTSLAIDTVSTNIANANTPEELQHLQSLA